MPLFAPDINFTARKFKSGVYYAVGNGNDGTGNPTLAELRVSPLFVGESITIDRIAAEVTTAGAASSVVRLGIYRDNGHWYPGDLLLDAGTIDGTSQAIQEITISQLLVPGLYWLGSASQVATVPSLRTKNTANPLLIGQTTAGVADRAGWTHASATGALPSTFTTTAAAASAVPKITVRVV